MMMQSTAKISTNMIQLIKFSLRKIGTGPQLTMIIFSFLESHLFAGSIRVFGLTPMRAKLPNNVSKFA